MTRVAVLDDYQGVALEMGDWAQLEGIEVDVFRAHLDSEDAVAARLEAYPIIVAMRERTPFPRTLLERLPNLRLLVTTGMRNAAIDLRAATDLGIVVSGTHGAAAGTSELTWGLILGLIRHIPAEDAAIRRGEWQNTVGMEMKGKTLGLLGLGNLGSAVARVGAAFDMEVIAWSQNLDAERAAAGGAALVTKDELFARSDIVSVHLVLSERTRGLVSAREFALMKPSAYFVNTSRGPIVDEAALLSALDEGRIAGAALDVFDVEPLPAGHAFTRLSNVLLTPHLGYVTDRAYRNFYDHMVDDIGTYLRGQPARVLNGDVLTSAARRAWTG